MTNEEFQMLVLQQFESIDKRFESIDKQFQDISNELKSLKDGHQRLELRMENEVIDKIGSLFDGYSLRRDQIENLKKHFDERFDSVEIDTGYLVSRVARLEKLAK